MQCSQALPVTGHGSPSLYATFKLIQLVNSFRKRVKTRVLSHASGKYGKHTASAVIQEEFYHALDKTGIGNIDRHLQRETCLRHGANRGRIKSEHSNGTFRAATMQKTGAAESADVLTPDRTDDARSIRR